MVSKSWCPTFIIICKDIVAMITAAPMPPPLYRSLAVVIIMISAAVISAIAIEQSEDMKQQC